MLNTLPNFVVGTLSIMSVLFIFVVGAGFLTIVVFYLVDVLQTKHAIRRNYPVIGRFRYLLEHLGIFFANISLPWIAKKCRSTGSSAATSIVRPRT